MNFLIGLIIIAIVLSNAPYYATPQLMGVESWCSAGGENGLQPGDTITALDGRKITIYQDFTLATMLLPDGNYDITVLRNGETVVLEDVPMVRQPVQYEDGTTGMLYGLTFSSAETTAESVPGRILPTALNYVDSVIVSIKMLFTGQAGIQDMSGPVGIVKLMSDTAEESETTGLALLNLLSIGGLIAGNLAVMNLLPLPALDGGRVVCLLLILMAIITFKDIFTLFR